MDEITRSVAALARAHVDDAFPFPDTADASLAGLDSLALVGLIVELEAHFSIQFPAEMIAPETFGSVRSIADAVHAVRAR